MGKDKLERRRRKQGTPTGENEKDARGGDDCEGATEACGEEDKAGKKLDPRVFAGLTALIGGPYALYLLYIWLHLQSGQLGRPYVPQNGLRQVLIVGSQSSGTSQLAAGLQELGLEVEHESSDARWSFCRDGTVSPFHGVRFLDAKPTNQSLAQICSQWFLNMGFHPAMFRSPRHGCSYRSKWSRCWRAECINLLSSEWGCGLDASCETPYLSTLLLVRHPLRTLESLVSKFCLDSTGGLEHVHPYLALFTNAFFPTSPVSIGSRGCLEVVGWYYILWSEALLRAHDAGAIHSVISVERSDACGIARAGGFMNATAAIFAGSREKATRACQDGTATEGKRKQVKNRRNRGRVELGFGDLWSKEHEMRVRALAQRLGYTSVFSGD